MAALTRTKAYDPNPDRKALTQLSALAHRLNRARYLKRNWSVMMEASELSEADY